ncbi:hypothetical protein Glove_393g25 [Diversispora epigaea]|uniref:Uncharacterized protein n=1 Tax=Diversispora epigaea TaxID=1348612 RepID=A0A397H5G4_9GLOM|nr:hypothetical protein Glove_393g25 [Diversispora epigaea]
MAAGELQEKEILNKEEQEETPPLKPEETRERASILPPKKNKLRVRNRETLGITRIWNPTNTTTTTTRLELRTPTPPY